MRMFQKKLTLLVVGMVAFSGVFFTAPNRAEAVCEITDAGVRPNGVQPTQVGDPDSPTINDFPGDNNPYRNGTNGYPDEGYDHSNAPNFPPKVYIDVVTSGCQGHTINLVILQHNAGSPNDPDSSIAVEGSEVYIGSGTPQVPGHNTNNDSFTVKYNAGDEWCTSDAGEYDCRLYFRVIDTQNPSGGYSIGSYASPALLYDNDGGSYVWEFGGVQDFGTTAASDTPSVVVPTQLYTMGEGADQYLAPLPGLSNQCSTPPCSGIGPFLKSLFNVLIMIAGILAFIMLVLGGITYATADAIEGHSSGKDMMWNAVLGLIIALGAWVILNTINPNLASNLSITIPKATFDDVSPEWQNGNAPAGTVIVKPSKATLNGQPIIQGSPWPSDATQRAQLAAAGITVNTANNCPTAGTPGCTSLYFESSAVGVIDQLIAFRSTCNNCEIVVTGGSEAWLHSSHGPNKKVLDLRATPTLNAYLRGLPGGPAEGDSFPTGKTITVTGFGKFYAEPPGSTSNTTAQHWHVRFN